MFIHLGIRTEFSFNSSIITINELKTACNKKNITGIGIVDLDNVCASLQFSLAMANIGVKPIIGCELTIQDKKQITYCTVFIKNQIGWESLSKLLTKKAIEKIEYIPKDWLLDLKEIVIIIPSTKGELQKQFLQENDIQNIINFYKSISKDFYISISRIGRPLEEENIKKTLDICKKFQVPVVAINDIYFLEKDHFFTQNIKAAIKEDYLVNNPNRKIEYFQDSYLKDQNTMCELFKDIPSSIENTIHIAKICNFMLQEQPISFPKFTDTDDISKTLRLQAYKGLKDKLLDKDIRYINRLEDELNIIKKCKFQEYFLIVWDIVKWAKSNDIPVGSGRGSAASSLTAFCLNITEPDPIKYNLLFERFINQERVTIPDIDIDFCQTRREEVIQYIIQKYGQDRVSQIATFNSFLAKSSIRDVGRVLGFSYRYVDKIAKKIPNKLNITIKDCIKDQDSEFYNTYKNDKNARYIIDQAIHIEGLKKTISRHAAGIVIAPYEIHKFIPLYYEKISDKIITHIDMKDLEKIGLIKFDILGIKTLSIIKKTIKKSKIDINDIPENDIKTFKNISKGFCYGIFQLESKGIKILATQITPKSIQDLGALISLYRPGPLLSGMVKEYINVKTKNTLSDLLPCKISTLFKETYGLIVYQEQIMQIANEAAGLSFGRGSILLKAIGKKQIDIMHQIKNEFINGCIKKEFNIDQANQIYNAIQEFAKYGFNKAHAISYAIQTYRTGYLKTHYPLQFLCSVMSFDMNDTKKIREAIKECVRLNIKIYKPCIFKSKYTSSIDNGGIRLGIGTIMGVGEKQYKIIKENINKKPIQVILNCLSKKTREGLAYGGALDKIGNNRCDLAKKQKTSSLNIVTSLPTNKKTDIDMINMELKFLPIPMEEIFYQNIVKDYLKISPIRSTREMGIVYGIVIDQINNVVIAYDYHCFFEVYNKSKSINIGSIIKVKTNRLSVIDIFKNCYRLFCDNDIIVI